MRWASLGLMGIGLGWAATVGVQYFLVYAFSLFLFWGYSTPLIRWKGRPWKSIVVIALSTGTNSFVMGCLAAGNTSLGFAEYAAAVGVGLMLVSLYPGSQIYQVETDRERGDLTFAMRYGIRGVRLLFTIAYITGMGFLGISLYLLNRALAIVFVGLSLTVGCLVYVQLSKLKGRPGEYSRVMGMKYGMSISFIVFIVLTWIVIY